MALLDRGPYTAPSFYKPAIAWMGTELVVVFDSGHRLYAAYVDGDLHTTSIVPIPGGTGQGEPAVATDGSELFVAWDDLQSDRNEIWFGRLDASGRPLDPGGVQLAFTDAFASPYVPKSISLDVVWTGDDFGIGWASGVPAAINREVGLDGRHTGKSACATQEPTA